ncbi:3-hydroxyacyl-ACP dehydratase FabZ [Planctomyces sp. SH-PL62]|uniref:3-hydroxyacyl-ACP dehydratase FabZ n=1 Tax=Planctomyces sp. SH-PL62 TaxID=1636152 RepID=UPI00078C2C8C|nr:3-hydroxyacyl-ACP dehydratase FabZ [Planctomyces sp. SH-PL62]AMV39756.1 UDP-3-O-[3-hydroxymyristoyl] N-acetylglucosamine deacetylase [Planctomyces sp. SH-PL62]
MLIAKRPQRTLAREAVLSGVGFFHGADVNLRFLPAEPDSGIRFVRTDLPGRPGVAARIDQVVPTQRRTAVQDGAAKVEMIEHVMAAFAGMQVDNCTIEIDAPELPGLDGSSRGYVEMIDEAGVVEQARPRQALSLERSVVVREGDAVLAAHPNSAEGLTLSYHLDYGQASPIGNQSVLLAVAPDIFRREISPCRTFLLEQEAKALRAAGIGLRASEADVLLFGPDGVVGNALRFPDECARHKVLDMVGDLALLGMDLHAFVVAHRSGHHTNALLVRKLIQSIEKDREKDARPRTSPLPIRDDGTIDIQGILEILPHRYPMLLLDRVVELEPGRRVVGIKNVCANEPFFQGHWPGRPIMPGVLILEAMAQAAGVLIASTVCRLGRAAVIASVDGVKLRRQVIPGDQLRLEVEAVKIKSAYASVRSVARVGDAVAAEARIRFVLIDAPPTA